MTSTCTECIKGTVHNGHPKGTEKDIHGLNTYVVGNQTNPKATVVIYSDVFGLALSNNKLIADNYAQSGEYLVYLPDFFQGDPVGLKMADLMIPVDAAKQSTLGKYTGLLASAPSFIMWLMRHKNAQTDKTCMDFMEKLRRATPPAQKIGFVGFCWGGRYALRAARKENMIEIDGKKTPLVDAVVALHPSNLVIPEDVEDWVVPVSTGWGVDDIAVSYKQKAQIEGLYEGKKDKPEIEHKSYSPGRHGFAVRGNPDDAVEKKILDDSVMQAMDWMKRWL